MQSFSSLREAVLFLVNVLEEVDYDTLTQVCHEELPQQYVLDSLRKRHESTPLIALYADREFPEDAETYKLGGHRMELGHIHIDFVKSSSGWELEKVWMCR